MNEPSLIGASSLKTAESPIARGGLRESIPCVATGTDFEGKLIVVVFTDSLEVDIVGFGVDALTREIRDSSLVVVVKNGNFTPSLSSSISFLKKSARLAAV
jgi:hypothetical protein